jgi:hypothetical protein
MNHVVDVDPDNVGGRACSSGEKNEKRDRSGLHRGTPLSFETHFFSRTIPDMSVGLVVALGIVALFVFAMVPVVRSSSERRRIQHQHPSEPWLWRPDWAERVVRDENAWRAPFLWLFGIVWMAITLPAIFAFREQAARQKSALLFMGLFPIIGVGLIAFAVYQTLRRRKYGVSVCRLERVPVPLGSSLRAEVHARVRDLPEKGFDVRLACVRRVVTGSGKHRSTSEMILWHGEATVASGAAMPNPEGMRIPIRFTLPRDAPTTDASNPRDSVLWRLDIRADVPGVDYAARFELPVFGADF